MKERWTGERIKADRAAELSGIGDVAFVESEIPYPFPHSLASVHYPTSNYALFIPLVKHIIPAGVTFR